MLRCTTKAEKLHLHTHTHTRPPLITRDTLTPAKDGSPPRDGLVVIDSIAALQSGSPAIGVRVLFRLEGRFIPAPLYERILKINGNGKRE